MNGIEEAPQAIANLIERYLVKRPDAQDTLEGIAGWWVKRQILDDSRLSVLRALEMLEQQGVVRRIRVNGVTYFRKSS